MFGAIALRRLSNSFLVKHHCFQAKRGMRLLQFVEGERRGLGVEVEANGAVVDLCKFDSSVPSTMKAFLEDGARCFEIAERYSCSFNCNSLSGRHGRMDRSSSGRDPKANANRVVGPAQIQQETGNNLLACAQPRFFFQCP